MARDDFVEVVYRTGAGTASTKVVATINGGSVRITEPRRDDLYVTVEELNQVKRPVRTVRVGKSDVVILIEGHETPKSKARAKKVASA